MAVVVGRNRDWQMEELAPYRCPRILSEQFLDVLVGDIPVVVLLEFLKKLVPEKFWSFSMYETSCFEDLSVGRHNFTRLPCLCGHVGRAF